MTSAIACVICFFVLSSFAFVSGAATPIEPPANLAKPPATRLKVLTSFSILQNLVQEIGADAVEVQSLIPSGVDPHGFNPKPSDVMAVKSTDLFVTSGLGLDPWTTQLWKSAKTKAPMLDVSMGLKALKSKAFEPHHQHKHGSGQSAKHSHGIKHDHMHGDLDPHYWHDPQRVRQVIDRICETLIAQRPEQGAMFLARAQALKDKIQVIEHKTRQRLAELELSAKKALSPHDGFQYLGEAFGIEFVSVLGVSTAQDLSAARLAGLQTMLKAGEIQAAFFEQGHNPSYLKPLLGDLQIPTETLYSDALTKNGGGAESYLELLKTNTDKLVRAFQLAKLQSARKNGSP